MLRTAFVACLFALLVAAPAAVADSTRTKILRECQDGRLTGNYTPSQIRDARNNIPDDIDQYSNCRDVLTRALLAGAADSGDGGNGGGTGGSGPGSGSGGGNGGGRLTPSTDADRQALEAAAANGGQPLEIAGRKVSPGAGSLRNDLPTTLIVVLALLAVAAVGASVPFVRRSVGRLSALGPMVRRVIPGRSG
ncbi:MAG TPA: hypothetical protein VFX51_27270 [Solirubrobacteraceae bacterium]|nr:hypothetical protein [Solirubrobacteraceae bacterium]